YAHLFTLSTVDLATDIISSLPLHDALPISWWPPTTCCQRHRQNRYRPPSSSSPLRVHRTPRPTPGRRPVLSATAPQRRPQHPAPDRKSTRLNSSHVSISYAVFCLKKKSKPA